MEEANNREKIDIPIRRSSPRSKSGAFQDYDKESTVFASALDLRSLDDVEKETAEVVDVASPRGVLEDRLQSSDSETCSSKDSTSCTESAQTRSVQHSSSLWKGFFRLWRQKSMKRLSSFPPLGAGRLSRWKSNREANKPSNCNPDSELSFLKPSWKTFTIAELQNATNSFSQDNVIGKGGFAEVYKGCLEDGQLIAVKRLTRGTADEITNNFLAELGILVHINHPNIGKLIGVGFDGGMHLILSLSPHGSLSNILHEGSRENLDWGVRYKVAVGTANGLEYLHERGQRRIIHRDIKAANILLTEDFEPQICDFGLAKWLPDQLTHHTVSSFEGTFGYLAPEYLMHGVVDEKTDVFAFGVLLLELISGRKAIDSSQQSLLMWARPLIEKNELKEIVDPSLGDSYDREQLEHLVEAASLCTQQSPILRPRMSQVLGLLKGEVMTDSTQVHQVPLRRRTYSEELFDAEEYNATRYLNDLNRHMQLALDFKAVPDRKDQEEENI